MLSTDLLCPASYQDPNVETLFSFYLISMKQHGMLAPLSLSRLHWTISR
jgi:hypothetical protein